MPKAGPIPLSCPRAPGRSTCCSACATRPTAALAYHRKLRGKAGLKSLLDEVEGIGEVRRRELLKAFGTLAEIEKASPGELAAVKGMNKKAARAVYDFFHRS